MPARIIRVIGTALIRASEPPICADDGPTDGLFHKQEPLAPPTRAAELHQTAAARVVTAFEATKNKWVNR